MRQPSDLTHEELATLVSAIADVLWPPGEDPDAAEWSGETASDVARLLSERNLQPNGDPR